jgi:hypothetical protein
VHLWVLLNINFAESEFVGSLVPLFRIQVSGHLVNVKQVVAHKAVVMKSDRHILRIFHGTLGQVFWTQLNHWLRYDQAQ